MGRIIGLCYHPQGFELMSAKFGKVGYDLYSISYIIDQHDESPMWEFGHVVSSEAMHEQLISFLL